MSQTQAGSHQPAFWVKNKSGMNYKVRLFCLLSVPSQERKMKYKTNIWKPRNLLGKLYEEENIKVFHPFLSRPE
jgi:hypothetical protein